MSKILIDTNVMVYSIDQESRYFSASNRLINSENNIYISSKSLAEFFAVVTRAPVISISAKEALEIVEWFTASFQIVFPDYRSLDVLLKLLKKHQPKGLKIHDFEILSIGIAQQIDELATFNAKDFAAGEGIAILDLKNL
ncbi:MAG TPA: PIN domain-containing protein [Candidatus Rifleibacterium sp.]|nr:PIN domain-containing protein [Candidatus Rifleibacterium sp.]